jgi:glycosyltransferase involved in cell wall biosynthesis
VSDDGSVVQKTELATTVTAGPSAPPVGDRQESKICVVLPSEEPYTQKGGAIATVTRNVTRAWTGQGLDVTVVASGGTTGAYQEGHVVWLPAPPAPTGLLARAWGAITDRARAAEIRLAPWGGADSRRYRRAVHRTLSSLPVTPDVVIVHNDPLLARTARRAVPRARSVLWLHNQVDPRCRFPRRFFAAPGLVVAVSAYIAEWTERRYSLSPGQVRIVHNGVDLERFHPADRAPGTAGPKPGPVRVVCHGRIDPNKGFHLAVDAVGRLRREGRDVTLTVAGAVQVWHLSQAEATAYGDRLIADLEAAGGTYLGRLDPSDVPALLRQHDIACVPSLAEEPFSLSALEAMASGCALVASRRGGLPEVAGDAGCLFDPDDPDGLVAALRPLVADPRLLADRRREARIRSERFPWTATAEAVLRPDRVDHTGSGR